MVKNIPQTKLLKSFEPSRFMIRYDENACIDGLLPIQTITPEVAYHFRKPKYERTRSQEIELQKLTAIVWARARFLLTKKEYSNLQSMYKEGKFTAKELGISQKKRETVSARIVSAINKLRSWAKENPQYRERYLKAFYEHMV